MLVFGLCVYVCLYMCVHVCVCVFTNFVNPILYSCNQQMVGFLIFTVASVAIFSALILSVPGQLLLTITIFVMCVCDTINSSAGSSCSFLVWHPIGPRDLHSGHWFLPYMGYDKMY